MLLTLLVAHYYFQLENLIFSVSANILQFFHTPVLISVPIYEKEHTQKQFGNLTIANKY